MNKDRGLGRREFLGRGAAVLGASGLAARGAFGADPAPAPPAGKILNYNPNMDYRRLGKTGFWVSAVGLGGHWKRLDRLIPGVYKGGGWQKINPARQADFDKNRSDVISRCIDLGINLVDPSEECEVLAYTKALRGRRDRMFLSYGWEEKETRFKEWRTTAKLLQGFDEGLKDGGLDYVDLWRISALPDGGKHTPAEVEAMIAAFDAVKKQGKARWTGVSSHDRKWLKMMIETYPRQIDVVLFPYTARTRELRQDSLFDAVKAHDAGVIGIKPFGGGSLFKGSGAPGDPETENDDRLARLVIRSILHNPLVATTIPSANGPQQVENVAKAVKERRELDREERGELNRAMEEAWARLPDEYRWLRAWDCV
jgi:aryl-alcohol dehydrogenase-like predicted oxidoreductase